ncbi:MAG: hypothetical protein ACRYFS_08990 [Janthinobacterium lividum]
MPSLNELSGIAHNLAHHSQSSLSWLHPHLGQACRLANVTEAQIELLDPDPYPLALPQLKPLKLALQGLQAKFWEIVDKQQLPRSSIHSVRLEFHFWSDNTDNYSCSVRAIITAANGKTFRRNV